MRADADTVLDREPDGCVHQVGIAAMKPGRNVSPN